METGNEININDVIALQYILLAQEMSCGIDTCNFPSDGIFVCSNGPAYLQPQDGICTSECKVADLITIPDFGETGGEININDVIAVQYALLIQDRLDCGSKGQSTCNLIEDGISVCKSGKAYIYNPEEELIC